MSSVYLVQSGFSPMLFCQGVLRAGWWGTPHTLIVARESGEDVESEWFEMRIHLTLLRVLTGTNKFAFCVRDALGHKWEGEYDTSPGELAVRGYLRRVDESEHENISRIWRGAKSHLGSRLAPVRSFVAS